MRRIGLIAFACLCCGLYTHGAPPKKDRDLLTFPIGSEASVILVGDELKFVPLLAKSTVVTTDSVVLLKHYDEEYYRVASAEAYLNFGRAIFAGDPDGIDVILGRGQAVRVPLGTKVRVIRTDFIGDLQGPRPKDMIPVDRQGHRTVRIIEGPSKGVTVDIPARNLAEIDAKPEPSVPKKTADPEKRAATLLTMAKNLDKLKKTTAALKAYREIAEKYPTTPAGKEAAERAKELGSAK